MTHLELVTDELPESPFAPSEPLPRRLPRGRHGIPSNLVVEHQRRRLIVSMTEALGEYGYANVTTTHVSEGAGVSTSTFYKHFGNLWDCLLAAYVTTADRLCEQIEAGCSERDQGTSALEAGIGAALAFLASEPASARLLCAQPPLEAVAIGAARRRLIERLAAMLERSREACEAPVHPPGLDERMIDATLAFLCTRVSGGKAESLTELGPELTAILDRRRRAA